MLRLVPLKRHVRSPLGARAIAATAATLALLACGAVHAQNAPATAGETTTPTNGGNELQQVIVTAQFVKQSAQSTPLAITAISGSSLSERGQTSLAQVAADAPSVNLAADETAFGPTMAAFIRGIGQYDLDPALEPGVGIYIDDVYFGTTTGSLLDLLDLDRVEVLRGPQGTLEGMNSEGGAIKLFSKAPEATPSVTFDALYGSRNHVELRAMANFTLVPNKLYVRLSGVGNHQDGYVDVYDFGCATTPNGFTATDINGVTGTYHVAAGFNTHYGSCRIGQEGGKGYTGGRMFLRWIVNDDMTNDLIGDIVNQDQENPATTLLAADFTPSTPVWSTVTVPATDASGAVHQLPFSSAYVPQMIPKSRYASYSSFCLPAVAAFNQPAYCGQDRQLLKSWGLSDTFNWTITPTLSVTNILAQRGYSSSWWEDNDVSPWPVGLGGEWLEHHQFSEELRFNGNVGSLMNFTIGGYYFRELSVYGTHQDLWYAIGPGVLNFLGEDPILAHDKAGYVHTVWHLTSKLNLTLGARYTSQDKSYTYYRIDPNTGGPAAIVGPLNGVTATPYSANRWDYRVDVDYRWTPQVMTYAQVSTGFKGGGDNPRPFFTWQAVPFKPETLTNYELGLKSQWLQNHLRLNLDGYFSQYRDIQETLLECNFLLGVPAPSAGGPPLPCALPFNAGTAHEKGVEFETQGQWGGFEIDGNMSYLDFAYVGIPGYDPATGTNPFSGILPGMQTPFTSKWSGSLGLQYTVPVSTAGALTFRVDGSTHSGFYTNAVNASTNFDGGYTLYNGHVTWTPNAGNWQVTAQVLNFTDKFYYVNIFDLTSVGGGSISATPGPPIEADLEIKYTLH
jgi:iron complex outermembrane recepter protein